MRIAAISGSVLGLQVYRGFAPISYLAEISHADVFHQESNPLGTQRDIRIGQALGAYDYCSEPERTAFFPEVLLNARDPSVVVFHPSRSGSPLGFIEIDESKLSASPKRMISRVDGHHRLHFGKGDRSRKLPPIAKEVGFCLVSGLTQEQEAKLFLDINSNQRGMNTSHLDNLKYRLTPQQDLIEKHFDLYVAEQLGDDPKGPFLGIINKGGSRIQAKGEGRSQGLKRSVSLRSLRAAIARLLRRSRWLSLIPAKDAQYKVIRQYWNTVRQVFHQYWDQKESLLLKGIGITAMAILGADVIDRCVLAKDPSPERMAALLAPVARVADWGNEGHFGAYSGVKGAEKAAQELRDVLAKSDDYHELVLVLDKTQ